MNLSLARRLACSLALLCALLQPLPGSQALMGGLAVVASHGHALSFTADDGHVDLVLSHSTTTSDARHASEQHVHSAPGEGGHVVHLTGGDASRDSIRRGIQIDAPIESCSLPLGVGPPLHRQLSPASEPRAPTPALIRTVVLRI